MSVALFIRFQVLPLTVIRMSSSIRRLCWNCASSSWCAKLPVKAGSSGLAAFTSSGLTFGDFMCNFRSVSSEDPWWPESWRLTTIWLGVGLVTIPRMELSAAVLSTRLDTIFREELEFTVDESIYCTDSNCVLRYVENEDKRYQTFVANRVSAIRFTSDLP